MSEPTSAAASSVLVGLSLASVLPQVNGEAVFGALLGAWLVAATRRRLKTWQRLGSLLLSAGVGYLFSPQVMALAPFFDPGVAAFVAAVLVIPISIKVMLWVGKAQLQDILQRIRGGGA
ncbi:hypothetical protein DCO48_15535 [Pseudomonas sp. SDI]|uniref:putative holin n=1 Tax=Pseudomonas sp. SDI TaxID=2170734 RepID=UPI000DE7A93B|nr:putative holin [Pseudomonas sp. SDI]PWB31857.1 hypothetical protein DCO48_15535 [Pseudomonas sp. SDI]